MAKRREPDLISLAFLLVAERGWCRFSFTELARRAGVPLARVYAELPSRGALLRGLGRRLDAQMFELEQAELDGMTPRERVFELVMRRLDAMAPYKEGLRAVAQAVPRDPALLLAAGCNVGLLSRRLLDATETANGPAVAAVARRVIGMIYVRTFRVWLDDATPDMARTLAELDRRLQQAEEVARWVRGLGRSRPSDAPTATAA